MRERDKEISKLKENKSEKKKKNMEIERERYIKRENYR